MLSKIGLGFLILIAVLLVIKPPQEDGSSSSKKQEHTHKSSKKSPRLPSYRAPMVEGNTYNLEVVWWKHKGRFIKESVAWTKRHLLNKPKEARLIVSSQEARIKLRDPKAEAIKVKVCYALSHDGNRCFSWHGEGAIPPICLTRSLTAKNGKVVLSDLEEITLSAYNPRFLGPRVKSPDYPGSSMLLTETEVI